MSIWCLTARIYATRSKDVKIESERYKMQVCLGDIGHKKDSAARTWHLSRWQQAASLVREALFLPLSELKEVDPLDC